MAMVVNPPEGRVILAHISWETYERLLAERGEKSGTRFAYDDGALEIMTTSFRHEKLKHTVELLVEVIASEMKIPIQGGGSTTFKTKDLLKGFEPDACFYIKNVERVRGLDQIDLNKDPAPDLVIEIDLTTSSFNEFPIYSALAVPEVWRHAGDAVSIFKLEGNAYVAQAESAAFPNLTASTLAGFLQDGPSIALPELIRRVQEWMRLVCFARRARLIDARGCHNARNGDIAAACQILGLRHFGFNVPQSTLTE